MTDEERARLAQLVDALDRAVAARPDVLGSPVGFVVGALVGAAQADPESAFAQLAGFADMLAYIVMYVRGEGGDPEAVIAALLPPAVAA